LVAVTIGFIFHLWGWLRVKAARYYGGPSEGVPVLNNYVRFLMLGFHWFESITGFLVMLLICSYNGYIIISTFIGLTIGYWLLKMKADFNGVMNFIEKEDFRKQAGAAQLPSQVR